MYSILPFNSFHFIIPATLTDTACEWTNGIGRTEDGRDTDQLLGNKFKSKEACSEACQQRRAKDERINGVTWNVNGHCYCVVDMGSRTNHKDYESKYLTCEPGQYFIFTAFDLFTGLMAWPLNIING